MVKKPTDLETERRVLALLERALDLPAEERERLLEESCAGDGALRARLDRLIAMETEPAPAAEIAEVDLAHPRGEAAELPSGSRVGAYELVRALGRGGMGRVYEAIQESPRRRVALKMLRAGLDTEEARRRFRFESEILARLDHPNIAQIFEAGMDGNEVPFFALELVPDARTIVAHAREEGLDEPAILELFLRACDAVHHGHQRGVIHRDLKPENLLVDASGALKVIDFGIARAREAVADGMTRLTQEGQLVGTAAYMSPEQLEASPDELDIRTDVWSLGVVLYELLCERLPHDVDGKPLAAVVRAVTGAEPTAPRRLAPSMPADLEAILLHALERERDRRYPSANALAADLRRYLRSEPVEARRPGLLGQLRLYTRRNRLVVGAAAVVLASLVTAAVSSTLFGLEASRQRDDAVEARNAESAEREKATELYENLLDLSGSFVFDFIGELSALEGATETRLEIAAKTIEHLDWLAERRTDDPAVGGTLAMAYIVLGDVQRMNLGDPEGASESYRKAGEILEPLLAEHADLPEVDEPYRSLLRSEGWMAALAGDADSGMEYFERWKARVDAWLVRKPEDANMMRVKAEALANIGTAYGGREEHDQALACFREAAALRRKAADIEPDSQAQLGHLAESLGSVGVALLNQGRFEKAMEAFVEEREILEQVAAEDPDNVNLRMGLASNGFLQSEVLLKQEDFAAAVEVTLHGLDVLAPALEAEPSNAQLTRFRAMLDINHGRALAGVGGPAAARASLEQGTADLQDLLDRGAVHPSFADLVRKGRDALDGLDGP